MTDKEAAMDALKDIIKLVKNSQESLLKDDSNKVGKYLQQARTAIMEAEFQINK